MCIHYLYFKKWLCKEISAEIKRRKFIYRQYQNSRYCKILLFIEYSIIFFFCFFVKIVRKYYVSIFFLLRINICFFFTWLCDIFILFMFFNHFTIFRLFQNFFTLKISCKHYFLALFIGISPHPSNVCCFQDYFLILFLYIC